MIPLDYKILILFFELAPKMHFNRVKLITRVTEWRNDSPLFFSFVGTATSAALKKEKRVEEEAVLPVAGASVAKK
jgi:hypothetical protein